MEKLKNVIEQYGRWKDLSIYVERIETHIISDFSLCIENSKALLESISKEICNLKGKTLNGDESINKLVRFAFDAVGYKTSTYINTIGGSLSAIAHQVGNLRTSIGTTSHGKTINELKNRNNSLDELTREFLMDSIEIICCFLIKNFENENPRVIIETIEETLDYNEAEEFNEFWDDSFGEFEMGNYSYTASEILYYVDKQAFINEYSSFTANKNIEE